MTEESSLTPNKGGRPKSPLTVSSKLKQFGSLHTQALEELKSLNKEISTNKPDVQAILGFLEKTEKVTQSIFKASRIRFLQRGMLLSELMAAYQVETPGGSWTRYFDNEVQPRFGISKKTEELARGVWHSWLLASESGCDVEKLLDEPGTIHEFKKGLKGLLEGDETDSEPKPKPSPHDRIQKVRKQVGKQISATYVGVPSDDETYEELVNAVQSALADLEDYVASNRPSEAVVETPREKLHRYLDLLGSDDEVPFDATEGRLSPSMKERVNQSVANAVFGSAA